MNVRALVLATTAAILLVGTAALAQSGGQADPPMLYTVAQGIPSGGNYRLTSLVWHIDGTASSGEYRLVSMIPASPTLRGNGCCCTYLPCVLRNRQ